MNEMFDPKKIDLTINTVVVKNTLPAYRDNFEAWIKGFNPENLKTDEDYGHAALAVKQLKAVEEKFEGIKNNFLKGEAAKAIEVVSAMSEQTRQKRLALEKAIKNKKKDIKETAVRNAKHKLLINLHAVKYVPEIDIDSKLSEGIKGAKTADGLAAALESVCNDIIVSAVNYSNGITSRIAEITNIVSGKLSLSEKEIEDIVLEQADKAKEYVEKLISLKTVEVNKPAISKEMPETQENTSLVSAKGNTLIAETKPASAAISPMPTDSIKEPAPVITINIPEPQEAEKPIATPIINISIPEPLPAPEDDDVPVMPSLDDIAAMEKPETVEYNLIVTMSREQKIKLEAYMRENKISYVYKIL